MGESEVASFLSHLAVNRKVAASTQNQALNALVFVYKHVLKRPLGEITDAVRAKRPARLPVVLSQNEVRQILAELRGAHWLIACLQYGSGLQIASRTSIQSPGPSIITKGPGFFQTKQQDSARMHVTRRDPFFLIESVYQYRQQHFYDRDPVA